jgi:hypothetical protein
MIRIFKLNILVFAIPAVLLSSRALPAAEQYKLVARDAVAEIVDGKFDAAIKRFESYLGEHPKDLESMYGLAVAYAQKQEIVKVVQYVQKAVDEGLPFERFLTGPRDLLEPLTNSSEFKALAEKYSIELLHGPMPGCLTDKSAKFWVRMAHEVAVEVIVKGTGTNENSQKRVVGKTSPKRDFTVVLEVDGLKPGTLYEYKIYIDGARKVGNGHFRTFSSLGEQAKFQIGFGGAGLTPAHERMWSTIAAHNLPAFLFLGDVRHQATMAGLGPTQVSTPPAVG